MSRAISLLPALFLIRLLQVFLNFPAEFGGLFRPEPFSAGYAPPLILLAAVIILGCATTPLKQVGRPLQQYFAGFLAFNYLLIGLFHNKVGQRSFLCEVIDGNLQIDELFGLYAMDFFFQEPYYFWGLLWIAISTYFLNRKNCLHMLPAFIIPTLLPIRLSDDVFPAIAGLAMATATMTGIFIGRRRPATGILYFWCGGLLLIFAWMNGNAAIYRNSWVAALILSAMVWVPGIVLDEIFKRKNAEGARGMSWLIPTICGMTWLTTLTNVPLGRNLFNLWFSIFSLQSAAWATIAVAITAVAVFFASRLLKTAARPVFMALATLISVFYLLDCLVMYKTGLRPDLDTVSWVAGLENITSLTSTIASLNPGKEIFLPFALLLGIFLAAKRLPFLRPDSDSFKAQLIFALAAAVFYQSFTGMPGGLFRDPLLNLISSIQTRMFQQNEVSSLPELSARFTEIGAKLSHSNTATAGNGQKKCNLILVMLESTASQYVSLFGHHEKTWPQLEKYRDRMEIFPFFFSCFPESSNADFCVMSGLYPPDFLLLRQNPAIPVKLLADYLKAAGYDCSLFFSGFLGDTGLSGFYRARGFDRIYDAGNMPETGRNESWLWGVKEEHVITQIKKQLGKFAAKPEKPFFIYYRMLFPHAPFQSLAETTPVFSEEGHQHGNLVGRFKNCLLYQDAQIAGLLEYLDSSGIASSTVVMLVADHGTMLGETGRLGHGWNLDPLLTNVPMVIIWPQTEGFKENPALCSQVDILPTALAITDTAMIEPFLCQGRSLLSAMNDETAKNSRIFLSSMSQLALIDNGFYHLVRDKDANAVETFKISRNGKKTEFTSVPTDTADRLAKSLAAKKFSALQSAFLRHAGYYQQELKKTQSIVPPVRE